MEEKKYDSSTSQEEIGVANKNFPISILKKTMALGIDYNKVLKKSKTLANAKNCKSVSFSDQFRKPLHIIYQVEPIIYEVFTVQNKKKKSQGCACVII